MEGRGLVTARLTMQNVSMANPRGLFVPCANTSGPYGGLWRRAGEFRGEACGFAISWKWLVDVCAQVRAAEAALEAFQQTVNLHLQSRESLCN